MAAPGQIDYNSLAQQAGAIQAPSPQPPQQQQQPVDYAALAQQAGAIDPNTPSPVDHSSVKSVVEGAWHLPGVEEAKGFVKGGMQTGAGLIDLFNHDYGAGVGNESDIADYRAKNPQATDKQAIDAVLQGYRGNVTQKNRAELKSASDWLKSHSQQHGFFQNLGGVGESIAELMGPEVLGILGKTGEAAEGVKAGAKVATYADRLKNSQKVAQVLNDHPVLAKIVAAGLRTLRGSAESGAQTYVKTGGDTGEAAHAAELGAAIGAPLEGASAAIRSGIEHISPTVEKIGDTEVTRLASQKPHATGIQKAAATAEEIPAVQRAQQGAGQEIVSDAAKSAAEQHLGEVNEGRVAAAPYKFRVGDGVETEDPTAMRDAIKAKSEEILSPEFDALSDADQRAQLGDLRSMQKQMSEYHATKPIEGSPYEKQSTFEPVNIQRAVERVGSYGDAADELEAAAKPVYDRLDDLSGGRFTALREQNTRAWKELQNGGGEAAQRRLENSQKQMDALLSGRDEHIGDSVTPSDLSYANEAWKKAQILRDVHSHVESAFDTEIGVSARANAYRGFNGNKLRSSLKRLSMKYGDRQLSRMIGVDQYNNLVKLADITRTNADRQKFGGAVNDVAKEVVKLLPHVGTSGIGATIGYHIGGPAGAAVGAAAGEATQLAARRVMRAVATNPKIGRNLAFAIEAGARPEVYAPMIASEVAKENMQK